MADGEALGSSGSAIDQSNVGFKLLKKFGWKEGTGLGASEQGRLEPIAPEIKKNKRGLGAEKIKKVVDQDKAKEVKKALQSKKQKTVSKRIRKMLQEEEKRKEKEFEQAFRREFWPDNV